MELRKGQLGQKGSFLKEISEADGFHLLVQEPAEAIF